MKKGGRTILLFSNRIQGKEALDLYPRRWETERLFRPSERKQTDVSTSSPPKTWKSSKIGPIGKACHSGTTPSYWMRWKIITVINPEHK